MNKEKLSFEKEIYDIILKYGDVGYADIIELKNKYCVDKEKVKEMLEDIKKYIENCETISNFKKLYTVLTNIRQLIDKKEREMGI